MKPTSTPKLDGNYIIYLGKVDFSIGWTGGHLEFDCSHHPKAESKVSIK